MVRVLLATPTSSCASIVLSIVVLPVGLGHDRQGTSTSLFLAYSTTEGTSMLRDEVGGGD